MEGVKNTAVVFLKKVLNIREGEFRRVLMMQLNIFLVISTLLIIKPTISSLFLSDVGIEALPLAFILVAVAAGIIITFYSRILNRYPLNRIIHYTLLISVISLTLFITFLRLDYVEKWILYIFYVWVAVFGVLATSQFWILANIIFNPREAKRLFSLIGGSAIAGGIFGGYLTSILAPVIGSENLLFIGTGFLLLCIPLNNKIWYSNRLTASSVFRRRKRMGIVNVRPLRLIRNSKHLTYLALITALSVLVAKLVDYQFSAISSARILDEDELTSFFGFWFSNFNIISLLIQLFITRRVVGVFGVGVSLFFLPAGIFIGAIAVLVAPGLWSAVLIKSADGSLKQSLNKSAIELLALPIPSEIKNQAKSFIDVFIDSFATGLSGILLITLVNGLNLSVRVVSLSIFALIILWFSFAVKIRKEYLKLFKLKLKLNDEQLNKKDIPPEINNLSIYGGLVKVLESGNEAQILYVLANITDIQHKKLFPGIKKLLDHPSPSVITEAIYKLYPYHTENLSNKIGQLITHPVQSVKVAAIEYLIEHSGPDKYATAREYLNDPDYKISGAALYALAYETRDNQELKRELNLNSIISKRLTILKSVSDQDELLFRRLNLLRVISTANLPEYFDYIHEALSDDREEIRQQAIIAAGNTLDGSFIPYILPYLKDKKLKECTVRSLVVYGHKIIPNLRKEMKMVGIEAEIVKEFPAVIEKIATQDGVDLLFELLDFPELQVRHESLDALNRIKHTHSYLVFYNKQILRNIFEEASLFLDTLSALYLQQERMKAPLAVDHKSNPNVSKARKKLIRLLEEKLDENLDRIFKLLGLKYPPDEISTAYQGLRSNKPEMRINAIEFLDNVLEPNLKKILLPILETPTFESISKDTIRDLRIKIISQYECFSQLLDGKDTQVKRVALNLIWMLEDKRYIPIIKPLANHPDSEVRSLAMKAIKSMER